MWKLGIEEIIRVVKHLEGGRRQTRIPPELFGHTFVEADGMRQYLAAGIGNAQHLQDGWYLAFTRVTLQPFSDVETDIGIDGANRIYKILPGVHCCGLVAGALDSAGD